MNKFVSVTATDFDLDMLVTTFCIGNVSEWADSGPLTGCVILNPIAGRGLTLLVGGGGKGLRKHPPSCFACALAKRLEIES